MLIILGVLLLSENIPKSIHYLNWICIDELDGYGSDSAELRTRGIGLDNLPLSIEDQLKYLEIKR